MSSKKLWWTASAALLLSAGAPALAQEQPASTPTAKADETEIIVTARRKAERLLDVPQSVSVVDAGEIERQGITNFIDLAFSTPNVAIFENSNISGRTNVTIRGVPGRAGIYVDDVFVGDSSGYNGLLVDIDRVEVLRGPQGTLFGRNSISGAINTVTRAPSEDFGATVFGKVGDYGLRQAGAAITGPIAEGLVSGKLSAGYKTRDAYDTIRGRGDPTAEDGYLVLGQVLFTPSDDVRILASVDRGHDDVATGFSDAVRDFGGGGSIYGVAAADRNGFDRVLPGLNVLNTMERTNTSGFLRAEWTPGPYTLTSITAARQIDFLFTRDGEGSTYDILTGTQPVDYKQFSQEFRLAYDNGGAFSWLAGAYYFKDERKSRDFNRIGPDFLIAFVPALAPLAPALYTGGPGGAITIGRLAASATLRTLTGVPITTSEVGGQETFDTNEIDSLAFFGSVTWKPTPQWEATAGLRYTKETISASQGKVLSGPLITLGPQLGTAFAVPTITLPDAEDDNVSPTLSVKYSPTRDLTFYATGSKGFRSGGYNLAPISRTPTNLAAYAASQKFAPETVTNYEAGVKSDLLDGRLSFNAAVFKLDYRDFQRSIFVVTPTSQTTQTLNTSATVTGGELEGRWRATDRLTLAATYGYQKSEYDDYRNAPINTTAGLKIVNLTGAPLPFSPKYSSTISAIYTQPLASDWSATLSGDLQRRSSYRVTDADGTDREAFVGETTLVNAALSVQNDAHGLTFALRGANLNDEVYRTGLDFNSFTGTVRQSLSTPKVVTFEVRKTF
jgi:iron complex outermembrane receptor protein